MNETNRHNRGNRLDETLRTEAQRIRAPERPGLVAQIMQGVHAARPRAGNESPEKTGGRPVWLLAGATATAAVAITLAITPALRDPSVSNLPRQAYLPRLVESRVDPVLASREQDLAGELQRIRADLNSLERMVSIRLAPDSE